MKDTEQLKKIMDTGTADCFTELTIGNRKCI